MRQVVVMFALVGIVACAAEDASERRLFVEKVHRALQPSAPPLADSEIGALLELSDDEIVHALYRDPAAAEAVFGFSFSFLGVPIDRLHTDGHWTDPPFEHPPAANATRAFLEERDPLPELLSVYTGKVIGPLAEPRDLVTFYFPDLELTGATVVERGDQVMAALGERFASVRAQLSTLPVRVPREALCALYAESGLDTFAIYAGSIVGLPFRVAEQATAAELNDETAFVFDDQCSSVGVDPPPVPARDVLIARLDAMEARFGAAAVRYRAIVEKLEADPNTAFQPLDLRALGLERWFFFNRSRGVAIPHFYSAFWNQLPNSSTNYNRKRAAYVLDRFFCDDLRPVAVALPEGPLDSAHAADPACASCHYKLDPLAGLFRRNGLGGILHDELELAQTGGKILFDDGAERDYATYATAWTQSGYIRSTRDPSLNSYGESLDDLDELLRSAPEVMRCLSQRVFEYWNGTEQAVDPGFLDEVTADVVAQPRPQRLERAVTRVLTSATFRAPERNTATCYDTAAGDEAADRPPCAVASILRSHCTGCHGTANPMGGLDLARWLPDAGGARAFPHVVEGVPVPRAETLARMRERLTTSDLVRQMPQAQDMPLRAREQLVLWIDAQ